MPLSPKLYEGPMGLNLAPELVGKIYDLPPKGTQHLQREKEGIDKALAELAVSVPKWAAEAGISPDVYAKVLGSTDALTKIRSAKGLILKLAEVMIESEAWHEHEREQAIGMIVDAVKSAARRQDEGILAPFQETLAYNAQNAAKAAKTKRKNAAAQAKAEPEAPAAE